MNFEQMAESAEPGLGLVSCCLANITHIITVQLLSQCYVSFLTRSVSTYSTTVTRVAVSTVARHSRHNTSLPCMQIISATTPELRDVCLESQAYWPIFSRGAEPSLPENFFDSTRKNCYANLQYFVRLTPPSNY